MTNYGLMKGLYALCPYIVGQHLDDRYPSGVENNGIFIDVSSNHGAMSYGIDAFNARDAAGVARDSPPKRTCADFRRR